MTSGKNRLNNKIRAIATNMVMNMILVILPFLKVLKWAMRGAVLTIMMPPNSLPC